MNLKKIDKKFYLYLGVSFVAMVLIIIILLVIKLIIGNRVSFEIAENKIRNAAITYVKNRPELLPIKNESTRIEFEDLVNAELIKPFSDLLKMKEATCTAYVIIENNNEYYLYSPYLDCGEDYHTVTLSNKIKNNGTVTSGEGLYEIEQNYVFRGEKINNYVSFAGKTWRIIRINNDGSLRMMETSRDDSYKWDDRYNSDNKTSNGINDYRVSRIRDTIDGFYNDEKEFNKEIKSYLKKQNVCIGKRSQDNTNLSNSIECSDTLDDQYLSMIQANEFALASIDKNCTSIMSKECTNYNYLATFKKAYWTITGSAERSDKVYKIKKTIINNLASNESVINLVIHLSGTAIYKKGDGTKENPYEIKMA